MMEPTKPDNPVEPYRQPTVQVTPSDIMELAKDDKFDIAKMEKLMEFQIKWEERQAKKAYVESMAAFKSDPPIITKDTKVSYTKKDKTTTEYDHASLGNATTIIIKALASFGFSHCWETLQSDKGVEVVCIITHKMGHSEKTSLSAAYDSSGGKNSIQALGSSISYLERYTLFALTGLAADKQDDDGQGAGLEFITPDQKKTIVDLINDTGADVKRFLKFVEENDVETIPQSKYIKAVNALKHKKQAGVSSGNN